MATTNYKFEKRQRDLAKKKKQDEKRLKKLEKKQPGVVTDEVTDSAPATVTTTDNQNELA